MVERELWAYAAKALGLALRPTWTPFRKDNSFADLLRSIRDVDEAPSHAHWMRGEWTVDRRSVRVLVLLDVEVGRKVTRVIAEIDPPKLVGLYGFSPTSPWNEDDQAANEAFGHAYRVSMIVPSAEPFFDEVAIRAELHELASLPVAFSDSLVVLTFDHHEFDSGLLSAALMNVGRVAVALSSRRVPHDPRIVGALEPVATRTGLSHDAERFRLGGELGRLETMIAFEGRPNRVDTVAHATFRQPIGLDLALEKSSVLRFVTRLFGGIDVEVGDPTFDSAFVVKGLPDRGHLVRDFFARRAALRSALVALASMVDTFVFDDRHLEVRWTRPVGTDAILALCTNLEAVGRSLENPADRPYR